jgi:hypothetical protein
LDVGAFNESLLRLQEDRIIDHAVAEIDAELIRCKSRDIVSEICKAFSIELGLSDGDVLHFGKTQSLEKNIIFLDIHATGAAVDAGDLISEGKEGDENEHNHDAIIPRGVFLIRLEKLIGKIKDGGLSIGNEVIQVLVELASDDNVQSVYLLGHQVAQLFVQLSTLKIVFLKNKTSIAARYRYYID